MLVLNGSQRRMESYLDHIRDGCGWTVSTPVGMSWIYIGWQDVSGVAVCHGVATLQPDIVCLKEGAGEIDLTAPLLHSALRVS